MASVSPVMEQKSLVRTERVTHLLNEPNCSLAHVCIISRRIENLYVWFAVVTEQLGIFAGYLILLCYRLQ